MNLKLNLKSEEELILLCARTSMDMNTKIRIHKLIKGEINWPDVLNKASFHGLKPLLYLNLKNYHDNIPIDMSLLKDYFLNNTRKNLLFLAEMLRILQVLKDNDITAIPYKGPLMAIYAYGNLALREFGDIDIYINKSDIEDVKKILNDEGYKNTLKLDSSKETYYIKSQRELNFKKNDLIIEIHWNVSGFSFSFPNEFYFPINQDFKSITMNNQEMKIFSDEDLILILSVHVAGHIWGRLSWICDIAELIKNSEGIDWQLIIKKARYLAIERILYLNLSLSTKLFDLKLPKKVQDSINKDPLIENLEKQVLKLIFTPEKFSFRNKVNLRFKMREKKQNGLKDIIRILIIPRSDEWNSFDKNGPMALLYLLKRPIQIINRLREVK